MNSKISEERRIKIEENIMNRDYEKLSLEEKIKRQKWLIKEILEWKERNSKQVAHRKKFVTDLKSWESEAGDSDPEFIEWNEKMVKHYLDEINDDDEKIVLHKSKLRELIKQIQGKKMKNKTEKKDGFVKMEIQGIWYFDYEDREDVNLYCLWPDLNNIRFTVPKEKDGQRKHISEWLGFDDYPTILLFNILSGLIEAASNYDEVTSIVNQEIAIEKLGNWIIEVINQRSMDFEEEKIRRNELAYHFREKMERLKKLSYIDSELN